MGVTKKLAEFVSRTTYDDIRDKVSDHVTRCFLDWLGVALAGSSDPASKVVIQLIREAEGTEESTIIGEPFKTTCINAALVNGVSGHAIELDDIHEESIIHPAAPVIPAALAVAERIEASGEDLILSIAMGYETEIRIAKAVMPSHYDYWHPTGTCGTFGAAVATGKLLDMDEASMTNALGIASTEASGLVEAFGTMCKPYNAGRAARDGVTAALLAEKGFSGSIHTLENPQGYLYATSRQPNSKKIEEGLYEDYETKNTIFKRHACCGHCHGAIDAVIDLVTENDIKPGNISEIIVGTYPIAVDIVGRNYDPKTVNEAKFSLPYCVAIATINRSAGLESFNLEQLANKQVRKLIKRVKIHVDPEYSHARLGCAKVSIRSRTGEVTKSISVPKGYPKNPLTEPELERKFRTLSSTLIDTERIEELLKTIYALEKLENIRTLTALLLD